MLYAWVTLARLGKNKEAPARTLSAMVAIWRRVRPRLGSLNVHASFTFMLFFLIVDFRRTALSASMMLPATLEIVLSLAVASAALLPVLPACLGPFPAKITPITA